MRDTRFVHSQTRMTTLEFLTSSDPKSEESKITCTHIIKLIGKSVRGIRGTGGAHLLMMLIACLASITFVGFAKWRPGERS